ncbi:hypothetical protein [Mycolicibacterium sp.]|uniref:hypothetical protein n=1 Tax=Mycolicibacterium sp. TaxID=2320850 RepID=UPI001A259BBC|nr:hypothetical protein [Mycolicibacterium sp.]MBJ7341655.1 hypothetical protein [Mycolicibacterium sp.]
MAIHRATSSNARRRGTLVSASLIAGGMLLAAPAAIASAAPDPVPDTSTPDKAIGVVGNNINQFVGTLGTNLNNFLGTGGNNLNSFVGTGGNNVNQFVGTLGTNGLVFAGTLGNNLVGNPPNTGGASGAGSARVATTGAMKGSFQCNSSSSAGCTR